MTKIGEGKEPHKDHSLEAYRKEALTHVSAVLHALHAHPASALDEQARLESVMKRHMPLLQAAVSELKRFGVHKEAMHLEKSYKEYLMYKGSECFAAFEHDLITLRDSI